MAPHRSNVEKWKDGNVVIKHVLLLLCAGVLFSPSASAYYHFVRYLSRTAPFIAAPAKYDLNLLTNKTLPYYISEQGPAGLAPNDTAQGV
ncbi:MAG TPA: hypothetical protein VM120_24180, partial [Bryobacteraceae bacterium]|nr:hypothetical protein [Bryobacteraceae bacterium]